jgi:glycosyltransferase involved in cell wall biosynthesis
MRVTYYQRHLTDTQFSIERVFNAIRRALPAGVLYRTAYCRYRRGFLGRLYNTVEAVFRQGDINHITGDVHYVASLLNRRKTLITVHDCVSLHRLSGWKRTVFKYFWYDLPVARCKAIVCISHSAANELISLIPHAAGKIRVIHNPLISNICYSPKIFNAACPRILHLGVNPNKNLPRLIQALSGIPCHLDIIGRPPEDMLATLQSSGTRYSTAFNLTDAEVVQKYRDCDMVAFVSTYEGFGMPIVEGNATGRAVVTSNIGSMREVAGDAACLVDPLDIQSIRAGIMRIIEDREMRELLIQKGLKNVKRFNPETIAAHYASLYTELADKNH